jgi:hypothetical protein
MGDEVEKLIINDLINPDGVVVERYLQSTGKGHREKSELVVESGMNIKHDVKFNSIVSTVLNSRNVVARLAAKSALIDAAGPGRKVYQATVANAHGMNLDATEKLFEELGFIDGENKVTKNAVEKLEYYWVVPTEIASIWKAKPPFRHPVTSDEKKLVKEEEKHANDRKKLVNECLEKHVIQYVIVSTNEKPKTFSERETQKTKPEP